MNLPRPSVFRRALLSALGAASAAIAFAAPQINVRDHGVTPDSTDDATPGIERAIAAAKEKGATVFLPPGTFRHTSFTIDQVQVVGAGPGRTILLAPDPAKQKIKLSGTGAGLKNLTLLTHPQSRKSGQDAIHVTGDCREFEIGNLEIDGSNAAGIIVYGSVGRITGNRLINTRADSIHLSGGSNEIYIAGNLIRNGGDDCIAVVSYGKQPARCRDVLIENNDVGDQFWGRGITVVGGEQVTIRNNIVRRTSGAGIYIASESAYKTHGVSDVVVNDNTLDRTPFDFTGGGHDAITLFSNTDNWVENLLIKGNKITNTPFGPFRVGEDRGRTRSVFTTGNSFPAPPSDKTDSRATGARVTSAILGGKTVPLPANTTGFGEALTQKTFSITSPKWANKTLKDLDSRKATGARVDLVSTGDREIKAPRPEQHLQSGDRLQVTGTPSQLEAFGRLLSGG